jgi:hypothetical protein
MLRIILILGVSIINVWSFAQKADQTNAWIFYNGNHKISEKWGIHTEYQFRRSEFSKKKWQQSQIRFGLDYNISKTSMVSGGYSFIDTWAYGDFAEEATPKYNHYRFVEHRVWEQFITKQQFGRFYTQNRFRLEQRWIEHKTKDASTGEYLRDEFQYKNRARYRFMVQIPLNHKEMSDKTLFIQWSDEIFVNFGKGVKSNVFDQNRMYIALGWRFNHHCNLQFGYMNQFIEKSDGSHKENNHTMQVSITYNLDFTKKKNQHLIK